MTDAPEVRVDSVRKVYDDGNHNAFTDLCRFGGEMYLTFRSSPTGHLVVDDSRVVVLASSDGGEWREVFTFDAPLRDVRDPHFLVFGDTLFVYSGTWLCDPARPDASDLNDHLGYAAATRDGVTWEGPRSLEGTYGHYIWRAAAHGRKAYLCARRTRDFTPTRGPGAGEVVRQAALLESDDGWVWKWTGFLQEETGNEVAFLFEDDGSILAVGRRSGPAQVCRSRPPYREWTRTDLSRYVGGPMLEKWEGRYLVGGRKRSDAEGPQTALSWLVDDQLVDVAELPSGGDNSYPGFIDLGGGKGLLSYYSSHEGSQSKVSPCSIYLAELSLR